MRPPVLSDRMLEGPCVLDVHGPELPDDLKWAAVFACGTIAICTASRPNWLRRMLQWIIFGNRWYSIEELRKTTNPKDPQ